MGILRGLGKFFGSTIFTLFLALAILMMEMVSLTSYDSVNSIASGILEKQIFSMISEEDLGTLQNMLLYQCQQADKVSLPLFGGQPVIMNCEDVKKSDASQLPKLVVASLINSFYYKEFDCGVVECVRRGGLENQMILASNEGNQFYKNLMMYMWIGTGVGLVLLLVSVETWTGRLKGVGWNLVATGLPFLFLGYISSRFIPSLPAEAESSVRPLIESILSSIKNKFMIVLVIGVVLLVIGYALGFYLSRKGKKK